MTHGRLFPRAAMKKFGTALRYFFIVRITTANDPDYNDVIIYERG
jgi:hypothetical protein